MVACGGGDAEPSAQSTTIAGGASGSGQSSGASGAPAGSAGAASKGGAVSSGAAGAAGNAGAGGSVAGGGGQSGASGQGGAAGASGGPAGSGGKAGASGSPAGQGGTSQAGAAGQAGGQAGASGGAAVTGCTKDADCVPPTTIPPQCATAVCDPMSKACRYPSRDVDGDGHTANKCKSTDAKVVVETGDDCDDTDKTTYPGAWDGPSGDGNPNRCGDGIDQDCNGAIDDAKLADGTTCTCSPGDVVQCSEEANGKPIFWPKGAPKGICKYGAKTCLPGGVFGPCTNAIPPSVESCNGLDDDCDDLVDDGPPADAPYWRYDGDDDLHAKIGFDYIKQCDAPLVSPVECASCPGTTASGQSHWKTNIPADDCNDAAPQINASAAEKCDQTDNNCDGTVDEGCTCTDGATRACGSAATCNVGQQICAAGLWGACDGGPSVQQVKYCLDADADQYCKLDATCQLSCPGVLGPEWRKESDCTGFSSGANDCNDASGAIHPDATELCGDGVDSDCTGGDSNGYSVGSACNAFAKSQGACKDAGLFMCSGSLATSCPPTNPDVGKSVPHDTAAANGSWDWDCSGTIERPAAIPGSTGLGGGTCGVLYSRSCPASCSGAGAVPPIYVYTSPKNVAGCAMVQPFPCGGTVSEVSCVVKYLPDDSETCVSKITAVATQQCY